MAVVALSSLPLAGHEIGRMEPYGPEHVSVLIGIVMACVVLVPVARRWWHTRNGRAVMRAAGWILLLVMVITTVGGWLPETWTAAEFLPFHLSDWLRVILAIALITRAPWAVATSIFWGLTLNIQSVLTPDLRYFLSVPLEFLQYWVFHGLALVAAVVLVWGFGYRPTWRWFGVAYLLTLAWAVAAMVVNAVTGANYGYLSHAPAGASLLDVLGPWPWYVVVEAVVVAVVWALMTALFSVGRSRGIEVPGGVIWCAPVCRIVGEGGESADARGRPTPLARRVSVGSGPGGVGRHRALCAGHGRRGRARASPDGAVPPAVSVRRPASRPGAWRGGASLRQGLTPFRHPRSPLE